MGKGVAELKKIYHTTNDKYKITKVSQFRVLWTTWTSCGRVEQDNLKHANIPSMTRMTPSAPGKTFTTTPSGQDRSTNVGSVQTSEG